MDASAPAGGDPYEDAFAWVLRAEGGYVDDPLDRGGPTKYGITQRSWSDYVGHAASAAEVAEITVAQARAFYRECYWTPLGGDALAQAHPQVAKALFDMSILHGLSRVARVAQTIAGAPVDGRMGPQTRSKICSMDPGTFLVRFCAAMTTRFVAIAEQDPTQIKFLRGWVGRSMRLLCLANKVKI